jgi:hypothetical protein
LLEVENNEFSRFKKFMEGFERSSPAILSQVLETLNEDEKKQVLGLCRVEMIEVKPGVIIPRKILRIVRQNVQV